MGLIPGREYYFSTLEKDGRRFICIDCGPIENTSLEEAMKIVQANGLKEDSVVLTEQIRTIDKSRLKEKIGHIDDEKIITKLNSALGVSFGL